MGRDVTLTALGIQACFGAWEHSLVCWHPPLCPRVLSALGELGVRLRDKGTNAGHR